jgi:hypothetical protein
LEVAPEDPRELIAVAIELELIKSIAGDIVPKEAVLAPAEFIIVETVNGAVEFPTDVNVDKLLNPPDVNELWLWKDCEVVEFAPLVNKEEKPEVSVFVGPETVTTDAVLEGAVELTGSTDETELFTSCTVAIGKEFVPKLVTDPEIDENILPELSTVEKLIEFSFVESDDTLLIPPKVDV